MSLHVYMFNILELNIRVKILEYQCCNKFQTHQWDN